MKSLSIIEKREARGIQACFGNGLRRCASYWNMRGIMPKGDQEHILHPNTDHPHVRALSRARPLRDDNVAP